jgi:hypothetical protein
MMKSKSSIVQPNKCGDRYEYHAQTGCGISCLQKARDGHPSRLHQQRLPGKGKIYSPVLPVPSTLKSSQECVREYQKEINLASDRPSELEPLSPSANQND